MEKTADQKCRQTLAAQFPKKQFKQQQQQRGLKDDLIFNLRNSREFRFIKFVYTVRDVPNKIYESVRFRKINFNNFPRTVHVLSNMQKLAFSSCCFVTFVAVAVELCLLSKVE